MYLLSECLDRVEIRNDCNVSELKKCRCRYFVEVVRDGSIRRKEREECGRNGCLSIIGGTLSGY